VSLLRRYFNSLYPLACTWLRNLARRYPGCTLIPSRTILPIQVDPLVSSYISARLRRSYPTFVFDISIYYLSSTPSNITGIRPSLPACQCSAQQFISERSSFAVSPTKSYWTFRGAHDSLNSIPRSHATYRSDRSRHQERTAWTLLRHRQVSLEQLPRRSTTCSTLPTRIDRREYKTASRYDLVH
jgi:hypothetical protein